MNLQLRLLSVYSLVSCVFVWKRRTTATWSPTKTTGSFWRTSMPQEDCIWFQPVFTTNMWSDSVSRRRMQMRMILVSEIRIQCTYWMYRAGWTNTLDLSPTPTMRLFCGISCHVASSSCKYSFRLIYFWPRYHIRVCWTASPTRCAMPVLTSFNCIASTTKAKQLICGADLFL